MNKVNVTYRPATIDDSAFVATVMMEAVEIPMMEEGRVPDAHLVEVCRQDNTLYSWRNATIAEIDGTPVAALIAYEGKGYHEVKVRTFGMVKAKLDFDPMAMDDETKEGEYYLDSLAVLPEWRNKGIGASLLMRGVEKAQKQGLIALLACDPDNSNAYQLYRRLGFKEEGTMFIFGKNYLRMVFFS